MIVVLIIHTKYAWTITEDIEFEKANDFEELLFQSRTTNDEDQDPNNNNDDNDNDNDDANSSGGEEEEEGEEEDQVPYNMNSRQDSLVLQATLVLSTIWNIYS